MLVIAVLMAVSATPTTAYDRITDTTETVEEVKAMKFLTPYGVDFRVRSTGRGTSPVRSSLFRVWQTIGESTQPDGLFEAKSSTGNLLVDGRRVDKLFCGNPDTQPAGRFVTWAMDVHITQKGMQAIANASKLIEISCGPKVEKVEGAAVKAFASMARPFLRSDYASEVTQEVRDAQGNLKQDATGEKVETASRAPAKAPRSLGSDMAAARARKYAAVAACIAATYEQDEEATEQDLIAKCKGFIDGEGSLVFGK
jgi:hypothetical protein